jgi:hypothetical protein
MGESSRKLEFEIYIADERNPMSHGKSFHTQAYAVNTYVAVIYNEFIVYG